MQKKAKEKTKTEQTTNQMVSRVSSQLLNHHGDPSERLLDCLHLLCPDRGDLRKIEEAAYVEGYAEE